MIRRKKSRAAQKVSRWRARKKEDVPFLPTEIISNILQRLPARFLYDSCRLVCKTWADILHVPDFIKSNLLHADCGFFIKGFQARRFKYVCFSEWELKVVLQDSQFPGHLRDSSDGVLLIQGLGKTNILYVANPITKQVRKLPDRMPGVRFFPSSEKIVHLVDMGVFKVVASPYPDGVDEPSEIYVLTVGRDTSWRKLGITSPGDGIIWFFFGNSITVDGVIYWITKHSIFAVDLRDESIHYIKVPKQFHGKMWVPEKIGKSLCCMNEVTNGMLSIWLLKDMNRSEWVMFKSVNIFEVFGLEDRCRLVPVIYSHSQQVLLLNYWGTRSNFGAVLYNLKTGHGRKLIGTSKFHLIQRHTCSLVRV